MSAIEQTPQPARDWPNRQLFFGLALIVFGALLLADRLSPVELESGWPFFASVFGIWKLIDPPPSGRVAAIHRRVEVGERNSVCSVSTMSG